MKAAFTQGLELCAAFFDQAAKPLLAAAFPALRYSAGLIGYGSDVLGYDDLMSTDHMWGPRFHLFLPTEDFASTQAQIAETFATRLPREFMGYSTHFSPPDSQDGGTRLRQESQSGRVDPLIEYHTPAKFFMDYLGWDPVSEPTLQQWLTMPEQRILGATSGRMFHDDLGIDALRGRLAYFPHEVWLWLMASMWKMIAEEEPFTGRCGVAGDEIGSRVVAARQVQRVMRLSFLMEKRYAPYSKWLGTAFKQLDAAERLTPIFDKVLSADHWQVRDELLGWAYTLLAERHNALKLTEPLATETTPFFNRPFHVISGERFTKALIGLIRDTWLRSLPPVGSVSQLTDSVTVYDDLAQVEKLKNLYM